MSKSPNKNSPNSKELADALKKPGSLKILANCIKESSLGLSIKYALFNKPKTNK